MLGLKGGGEAPTFIKTQHICPWPGVGREEKGAEHVVRPVLSCQKHSKLDKQYKIYQKCGGGRGVTSIFVPVVMLGPASACHPACWYNYTEDQEQQLQITRAMLWLRATPLILTCTLRYFICHNSHSTSDTTHHMSTNRLAGTATYLLLLSGNWGNVC